MFTQRETGSLKQPVPPRFELQLEAVFPASLQQSRRRSHSSVLKAKFSPSLVRKQTKIQIVTAQLIHRVSPKPVFSNFDLQPSSRLSAFHRFPAPVFPMFQTSHSIGLHLGFKPRYSPHVQISNCSFNFHTTQLSGSHASFIPNVLTCNLIHKNFLFFFISFHRQQVRQTAFSILKCNKFTANLFTGIVQCKFWWLHEICFRPMLSSYR